MERNQRFSKKNGMNSGTLTGKRKNESPYKCNSSLVRGNERIYNKIAQLLLIGSVQYSIYHGRYPQMGGNAQVNVPKYGQTIALPWHWGVVLANLVQKRIYCLNIEHSPNTI